MRVTLLSGSSARRRMLESVGLDVAVRPHDVDEAAVKAQLAQENAPASDWARRLASAKARSKVIGGPVIASDQVVLWRGRALGKPQDRSEARARLLAWSGAVHHLQSAAVVRHEGAETMLEETVAVRFRSLGADEVDRYLEAVGAAALRSSAGYEIEGLGGVLIDRIEGDFFAALGMPLFGVLAALRALGVRIP